MTLAPNLLPTISRRHLVLAGALAPVATRAAGADAAPLPIESFFREAAMQGVSLSPAGTHVVAIRPHNGRRNLVVVDLATMKALIVTNFADGDVDWVRWANDQHLLFGVMDARRGSGDQVSGGLHSIRRDGNEYRSLSERSILGEGQRLLPFGTQFLQHVLDKDGRPTDEFIAETPRWTGRARVDTRLYRVNVANGRFTAVDLTGAPKEVVRWVLDTNAQPRVALTVDAEGRNTLHVRETATAPWRELLSYVAQEPEKAIVPLRLDRSGQLYVEAHAGSDTQGIHLLDLKTGRLGAEPVVAVKGFDIGSDLVFDARGDRLVGLHTEVDRPLSVWFDERIAAYQESVDQTLPGLVNRLQVRTGPDGKAVVLVRSFSDQEPGRYFLFRPDARSLVALGASRPWIEPARMRPSRFYRYDAADGLSIPAQLTLPAGTGPFPLVVLHYGGPWVRPIRVGFDGIVQFLASRGYAVFMPAPRASTGFGLTLFKAGWKQWGLGMQDDVTTGVQKLIADGVADPKRVALVGASYGGYLTMMGLVKEPALFRAGVNWVGVTDPDFMFSVTWSDFNRAERARYSLEMLIGDPVKDKAQFERTSPVKRAAEIKQPVLMAYGGLDERVPIVNGERMRDALKPHNPQVEWVVYPDEAHGGWRTATNVDFWGRVERFLGRHLKP